MTKKPLHFVVSGALLIGSLSACGASEHTANEAYPEPEINDREPESNEAEPEVNEHPEHVHPEAAPETNEQPEEVEPEVSVNELAEEPTAE